MQGYSKTDIFPRGFQTILDRSVLLIAAVGERVDPLRQRAIRCHELVRVVQKILNIPHSVMYVVDGKYSHVDHSWLYLTYPRPAILDVYSCGRLPQVQLVDLHFALKHETLYRQGPIRKDIDWEFVDYLFTTLINPMVVPPVITGYDIPKDPV